MRNIVKLIVVGYLIFVGVKAFAPLSGRCDGPVVSKGQTRGSSLEATVAYDRSSKNSSRTLEIPREPTWFRTARAITGRESTIDYSTGLTVVAGRYSATEERAEKDARAQLRRTVENWLRPDVPTSWRVPEPELDALIRERRVSPVLLDVGKVYLAAYQADLTADTRSHIYGLYERDLVRHRLITLGGIVGFVLVCLASLAGYIRADEATKGYYTNRLRLVSAVGVGAAGMAIYHLVV